jgi:hypothetical protein
LAKAPRGKKLKVFQAQLGFYDTVVATSGQAAALRAWGIRQNLFADGQAKISTDLRAVEAALAHPQTPLMRPVGSSDPFELDPANLPRVPDQPTPSKPKAIKELKSSKPPRPAADRSALDAAETDLRKLDDRRKKDEAELRERQEALDAERAKAQETYVEDRKTATSALVTAKEAYRKAGGTDV